METILQWVSHYGYGAIIVLLTLGIVGLPVPDEWLLTFTGYLVYTGRLHLLPAVGSALLGSVCGITISYLLGLTTGCFLLHKYGRYVHITPERVERVHKWFGKMGHWTLTFGYFIPGVRHLTAYVAGSSGLEWPGFAAFAYCGAFIWSATFITLGYVGGEQWNRVPAQMHRVVWVALAGVVLVGAAVFLWHRSRKSASGRAGLE